MTPPRRSLPLRSFVNAGPGYDFVDGGGGTDRVEFLGALDEYTVEVETDADGLVTVTVTDNVEDRDAGLNDGVTVLVNVEKLVFDDQTRTLDGRNTAPVIFPPAKRFVRGASPVRFAPLDLISLAVEFDGETLSLFGVGAVVNGAITVFENGTIVFRAATGFSGAASFAFTVSDPSGSKATGLVKFTVVPELPEDE